MNNETVPLQVTLKEPEKGVKRSVLFVNYIINRCQSDNGVRAALRRADNPATEYQSWEVLAGFGINLELDSQRLAYETIAAALARTESEKNGSMKIGQAIANAYQDGNRSDQAKAKLRRLIACQSVPEAVSILRPLLRLIESRIAAVLDYASLLEDLLWFSDENARTRTKTRWAQDFYGRAKEADGNES